MSRYILEDENQGRYVLEDSPAPAQAGKGISAIPRQLGLTARYGLEGVANTAQIVTEPIRQFITDPLARAFGGMGGRPIGQEATLLADRLGLPAPEGATERIVADATRLVAGAGGLGAAARSAAAAPGLAGKTAEFLAANLPQQFGAAAGAGLAGGAAREMGGNSVVQGVASVVGGIGGGLAVQAASSAVQRGATLARRVQPAKQRAFEQRVDQTINVTLQNQGVDPATVTPAMRTMLREQVGRAMDMGGELNPDAIARLADYTRLNMTPTRARLSLDPFDVTQEANASKLAAATGNRDARLPQIARDNNARLVGALDDMGGARPMDGYGYGSTVANTIRAQDDALQRNVGALYGQARDTQGRSASLNGQAFTARANQALDEALLGGALPPSVAQHMNRIAKGEVPFTVDYAEQLKTAIGNLQRGASDGQTRMALGVVRRALDDAPLVSAPQVNPGALPAVPGTVPPSPAAIGQQSINAFNQARQAARDRFAWQESSPVIARALEGANADTFIQQNILSKAAGYDGVARVADTINQNPAARDAVRVSIVHRLKDAAIGKGGTSQTGNFSGKGMEAALKDIGDRKLGLFFEPAEIETLKAMARTGSFETFQPRGSAVNNSNSAAGVAALVSGVADRVRPLANKLPFGQLAISNPMDSTAVWLAQRPAQNITGGLLGPRPQPPLGAGLLLPGIAIGGNAAGLLAGP
ncbi:hypothetical protein KYG_21679 [Acidovorax sp. NO-1]|nr:hypothetical protein KYG_21679 [Acidovorax sp. NO-1]